MNHEFWKYELRPEPGLVDILMPEGATVRAFAAQGDRPCIWAEVDPKAKPKARRFRLVMTGQVFPPTGAWAYIGTALLDGGSFVLHALEDLTA